MIGSLFKGVSVVVTVPYQVAMRAAATYYLVMSVLAVLFIIVMGGLEWYGYHYDKVGYYLDKPVAAARDHFRPTKKQLEEHYGGPRTEIDANGYPCSWYRCEGGYATKADYLKAHEAEFAAERQQQALRDQQMAQRELDRIKAELGPEAVARLNAQAQQQ